VKILYIEDNETQANIIKRMLEMLGGYEVVLVQNGPQALKIVKNPDSTPDVIITDRRLPKMTGAEIIIAVKNEPTLTNIPIIMLSADMMGKAKEEALAVGATAFFAKPVDFNQLHSYLQTLDL